MPPILAQTEIKASIDSDIAARTSAHKARIAALKIQSRGLVAAQPPLTMLAHGDSWFDYPLHGNDPLPLGNTDIIAQLGNMGAPQPVILNISHYGDATTDELSLAKQQRLIEALNDKDNWLASGKPDAILFSGGGNDIAGEGFCICLDFKGAGSGLDRKRFELALGGVEASYLDLFMFRDRYAPDVPITGHAYDFPVPNGIHPACIGPWLRPALDYTGWTTVEGQAIVKLALETFQAMLSRLAGDPTNHFVLVPTQGHLAAGDWANELHPKPEGFTTMCDLFLASLRGLFPGRI
jgi:hypothetical protein